MRRPGTVRPCHPNAKLIDEENEIYESSCLCSKGTSCQLVQRARRSEYKCRKDKGKKLSSTIETTLGLTEPSEVTEPTTTINEG